MGSTGNRKEIVSTLGKLKENNRKRVIRKILQELWISDLLGDTLVGVIGGSPSSLQTLLGSSANGTDMHTQFAKSHEVSRDDAKIINYCVPLSTQTLTPGGWKKYGEIKVGDKVLGFNKRTGKVEWTTVRDVVMFKDSATVRVTDKTQKTSFDFVCTPNHRWVLESGVVVETEQLMRADQRIKVVAPSNLESTIDITPEEINKIMGFWLRLNASQEAEADLSVELRELFKRLEIDPLTPNYAAFFVSLGTENLEYLVSILPRYSRTGISGNYTDIYQFRDSEFTRELKLALELTGRRTVSYTSNPNLGFSKSIYIKTLTKKYERTQSLSFTPDETQDVWCVTTDLDSWVIKQNDIISITGNSRRYGAGVSATATYFKQANKNLSSEEARAKAKSSIEQTKGKMVGGVYSGGLESLLFNALQNIALSQRPRTPALGVAISDTLLPKNVGTEYMPSRTNWVDFN